MKLYAEITKIDRERRMVFGYASTEALDSQGEVVRKEAIEAALPDYMRFANIREMHQPSAVGVAKEAAIDDKGLYLAARIVDDEAWKKVTEGVYKGFSIGGRVTDRDKAQKHVITGVELLEISLVDRPANPEAVIELYKAAPRPPQQIWDCGSAGHRHLVKAEAVRCIEQAGASALAARAAPPPPPAVAALALAKGMADVQSFAAAGQSAPRSTVVSCSVCTRSRSSLLCRAPTLASISSAAAFFLARRSSIRMPGRRSCRASTRASRSAAAC